MFALIYNVEINKKRFFNMNSFRNETTFQVVC